MPTFNEEEIDIEVGKLGRKLLWHVKRYNYGKELDLHFTKNPSPLPKGVTEDMVCSLLGQNIMGPNFIIRPGL